MLVNLVIFIFVKVASAIVVAITTPFKDLSIIVMSDTFVVQRGDAPLHRGVRAGVLHLVGVQRSQHLSQGTRQGGTAREGTAHPGVTRDGEEGGRRRRSDGWRFGDASTALAACCAAGILLVSTAVLAQVDLARVADAYSLR